MNLDCIVKDLICEEVLLTSATLQTSIYVLYVNALAERSG